MSDQSFKPTPASSPPVVEAPATTPKTQAGSRGNGFAAGADTEKPAPAAPTEGPGFFDRLGALTGSTHLRTLLGPSGAGVAWDDKEKGANRPNVDKWGNDRIRLAKLRIASVDRAGLRARKIQADNLDLNERAAAKDGRFVADLVVPTASAESLSSASPALEAAGIQLTGIEVHRDYAGSELTEFFTQPGDTRIEVQSASVTGLTTPDMQADKLTAERLTANTDGTNHTLGGARLHGEGIKAGGVSLGSADATGATASITPGGVSFAAQELRGGDVQTGSAAFVTVGTHGFSVKAGAGGVAAEAASAQVTGMSAPGVTVADASADRLAVQSRNGITTGSADRVQLGAIDARGFHSDQTTIAGASLTEQASGTRVAARQVTSTGVVAGTATIGSVSGSDGALNVDGGGVGVSVGAAEARDIRGGGVALETAKAKQLAAQVVPKGTKVTAGEITGNGLSGHGITAASVNAKGASLGTEGGVQFAADSLHAREVARGDTSAAALDATALHTKFGPDSVNASLDTLDAKGLRSGDLSAKSASLTGGTLAVNGAGTEIGANRLRAEQVAAGNASASHVDAGTLAAKVGPDGVNASLGTLRADDVAAGGLNAKRLTAEGARIHSGGGVTSGSARSASATNVAVGGVTASGVKGTGLSAKVGPTGTAAAADTLNATKLRADGVSLESADAKKLAVNHAATTTGSKTTASAASASGAGLVAGKLTAGRIGAQAVNGSVTTTGSRTAVAAGAASATGSDVAYTADGARTSADKVSLSGPAYRQDGDRSTTSATGTRAEGVRHRSAVAPAAGAGAAIAGGAAGGRSLTQQAAGLVDSAKMTASVPLNAGTTGEGTGRMTVKPGTTAYVEVQVQGGKIMPSASKATFSTPLDTWGWTSVPGVYISKDGKLFAEVNGMWDKDLTAQMNAALGRTGSAVPLRISDLAATSGGSGGSGASMARTQDIKAQGTVGLRAGTLRSEGMSATLGSAPGANVAKVEVDGSRSLSVQFSKLLLEAFGIKAGGATVDVKEVQAGNAAVRQAGGRTDVSASTLSTGAASVSQGGGAR